MEVTEARAVQRWRAADGLTWTRYEDSEHWVVYNPASGDLHLLTDSAHRLWTLARDEPPRSVEELTSELAARMACPLSADLALATQETLVFMDRAGLVNPVWPVTPVSP